MAEIDWIRRRARELMDEHLDTGWSFGFDAAKTRAGLCNYSTRRITVSRHLAVRSPDEDVEQVILHEIAHAMAGKGAGHGPRWRATARVLGYTGARLHDGPIAHDLAPWVGDCPGGHTHYRYKRPIRIVACGACARRFDPAFVITWRRRPVPATGSTQADTVPVRPRR